MKAKKVAFFKWQYFWINHKSLSSHLSPDTYGNLTSLHEQGTYPNFRWIILDTVKEQLTGASQSSQLLTDGSHLDAVQREESVRFYTLRGEGRGGRGEHEWSRLLTTGISHDFFYLL